MCNSGRPISGRSDICRCRRSRASPPCSRQGTCRSIGTSRRAQSTYCTFCKNACSSPRSPGKRAYAYNSAVHVFYRSSRHSRRRCHTKPPHSRRADRRNGFSIHCFQCRCRGRIRQDRHCSSNSPDSSCIRGRIRFLQSNRRSCCSDDPPHPTLRFPRICRGHSHSADFH